MNQIQGLPPKQIYGGYNFMFPFLASYSGEELIELAEYLIHEQELKLNITNTSYLIRDIVLGGITNFAHMEVCFDDEHLISENFLENITNIDFDYLLIIEENCRNQELYGHLSLVEREISNRINDALV